MRLIICLIFSLLMEASPYAFAGDRVWLDSSCYQLRLSVWDKLMNGSYLAHYVVKSEHGKIFVVDRNVEDDSNTASVIFPDDFHEEKTKIQASVNCYDHESYTWFIYANGTLKDTGTIAYARKGVDKRVKN